MDSQIDAIAFSADSQWLAASSGHEITIYELGKETLLI
jgi:hypothetical protein